MEWRDVPGFPGYQVSGRGRVRTSTGYEVPRRGGRFNLFSNKVLTRLTPAELLALTWPAEATAAGFPEPATEDMAMPERKIRQFGNETNRRCHDCGRPTNNYRCDACWALLRGGATPEESEWNAL